MAKNKHCCQLTINTFQESCLHGFKYYVQKKDYLLNIFAVFYEMSMKQDNGNVTELAMGTTFKSKRQNSVDLINMKNLVYFIFMNSFVGIKVLDT